MTPTIEEKVKFVREKCIEILPEIGEVKVFECGECGNDDQMFYRQIRLSDILLAIGEIYRFEGHPTIRVLPGGYFEKKYIGDILPGEWSPEIKWNLRDDDFDHQAHETKEFIWEILK